jgi:hypothetical protein
MWPKAYLRCNKGELRHKKMSSALAEGVFGR